MAQQKLWNDFDDLKINDDADSISNVLVLLIGVSKYSHHQWCDLNGVPRDIANYEDLWYSVYTNMNSFYWLISTLFTRRKDYNYDVLPAKGTKWYGKKSWTEDDIIDFVQTARKKLFDASEKALQYEAMIMVYCGHGLEGLIIASNGEEVAINDIHSKFSGAWLKKVTEIPRLFIFDCCRGHMKTGAVVGRGNSAHRADMICSLFGNSPGIEVKENKKGGLFSQCVIECMKKNKNNPKFTITDLSITLINKVQQKSKHGQTCWKEGDGRVDKKVFNVNGTKNKAKIGTKHKMYGMNANDDSKSNNGNDGRLVEIPLKIYDYNGCLDDKHHSKQLLVDNNTNCYMSREGVTSGDWIIFQVADNKKHTPKWLKINNWDGAYGIKDIRLLFHYSDSNGFFQYFKSFKWTNEQKITNIHMKNKHDQWFKLDMPSSNDKPLKYIKLIIDANNGGWVNSFYSFSLFA